MPFPESPAALAPLITAIDSHFPGQVHAFQSGKPTGLLQRNGFIDLVPGHQAAVLGALFPQNTGKAAGINIGNRHDITAAQIV